MVLLHKGDHNASLCYAFSHLLFFCSFVGLTPPLLSLYISLSFFCFISFPSISKLIFTNLDTEKSNKLHLLSYYVHHQRTQHIYEKELAVIIRFIVVYDYLWVMTYEMRWFMKKKDLCKFISLKVIRQITIHIDSTTDICKCLLVWKSQ